MSCAQRCRFIFICVVYTSRKLERTYMSKQGMPKEPIIHPYCKILCRHLNKCFKKICNNKENFYNIQII